MATAKKKAAAPAGPYCYALLDDGEVFYVGKGRGRRMYHHQLDALRGKPGPKCERIREIVAAGREVECRVLSEHNSDIEALEAENRLLVEMEGLLNAAGPRKPHDSGTSLRAELGRIRDIAERVMPFVEWMNKAVRSAWEIQAYRTVVQEIQDTEHWINAKLEATVGARA